jgi:OOP family OmpA-OmpF porin
MKRMNGLTGLIAFAWLIAMNASFASEQDGQWYVGALGTYMKADSARQLDNGFAGFKLVGGRALNERWNLEVEIGLHKLSDKASGPDTEFTSLLGNAMYLWNRSDSFTPYLLGGFGYLETDGSVKDKDVQLQIGPGLLWDMGERFTLRAELLSRWAETDQGSKPLDFLLNVGVQYAFGTKRSSQPQQVTTTPAPAPEPAPVVVAAAAPLVAAAPVADGDGDGVPDEIDECPKTIQGAKVDAKGCGYELTLSGANYEPGSADLTDAGRSNFDDVGDRLKEYTDVNIIIVGYTDSQGSESYNQTLSELRAKSARDHLVRKGISGMRIRTLGMGEQDPIASNDTPEGRADNRRVVLLRDGYEG